MTVSLLALAEVHYAVFPAISEENLAGTMENERHSKGLYGAENANDSVRTSDGKGKEAHFSWGCGNATATTRGPVALNDTRGLVTSGVVSSLLENVNFKPAPEGNVAVASAVASATSYTSGVPHAFTKGVSGREEAMEVVFRVEGLKAAEAYNVCLFTETPGSNGCVRALLGDGPCTCSWIKVVFNRSNAN